MAETVEQMIADIVRREGGYNDVPGDNGGATNDGISLRYLKGIGLRRGDLDHSGTIDKDDVRMVTPAVAAELYREDFYLLPRINLLPADLQPQLFDISVNSGPPRAIMLLQKTLSKLTGKFIPADGVVGPQTRVACESAIQTYGFNAVNDTLVGLRKAFYDAIVQEDPTQEKFIVGWKRRADSFFV